MIKFRYKRKEPEAAAVQQKNAGAAIQKQKIEGLRDRELLPPKDMVVLGSHGSVKHNTLPRTRPSAHQSRPVQRDSSPPLSQTTIALFRVSFSLLNIYCMT
ncbi:unnamed protein product [Plutella xylostella]|uniref:(diamondback moth) hypothetical protein n=1 Tax=Plutella xylostella TaxID=51655 RepID=A0A8S4G6X8_PLUXY|nr:unnamed protein product [Plutella xylostella]